MKWERDGTKLISRERKFDIDHDLPRSTTLVLHDVTEKDSGTYQCFLRFENEVEYSDPTLIGICNSLIFERNKTDKHYCSRLLFMNYV